MTLSRRTLGRLLLVAAPVSISLGRPPGSVGGARRQEEGDAESLLLRSALAMADVSSFHFELTTPRGKTAVLDQFELLGLEGDVQRPESFRATVTAKAAMLDLSLDVVGIGTRLWVSDPTGEEGEYFELEMSEAGGAAGSAPADLLNPDRLLLRAVELIETPTVVGRDEIDGIEVTRIDGTFDPARVMGEGTPPAGLVGDPLPVAIWIDDEGRVRRLEVAGPLIAAEDADGVRRLDLSAFDEPVVIEAPVGASTPQG